MRQKVLRPRAIKLTPNVVLIIIFLINTHTSITIIFIFTTPRLLIHSTLLLLFLFLQGYVMSPDKVNLLFIVNVR